MKIKFFNHGSKTTALVIAVFMFTLSIIGGLASIFNIKAFANSGKVNLVYNSLALNYAHGVTYTDDVGKSGIQFTTVKSGDSAEGTSFSFSDTMTGAFDMDFRVTSEKAYSPVNTTAGWAHYLSENKGYNFFDDEINAYLDLRQVGIKFASVADPDKYFILYIYGSAGYQAALTSAYVYVNGDNINAMRKPDGTTVQGFGYNYKYSWSDTENKYVINGNPFYTPATNVNHPNNYGTETMGITIINGTTFSNFLPKRSGDVTAQQSSSNIIKFDPATMNVYVNAGEDHLSNYSTTNDTANILVRDVASNAYFTPTEGNSAASISPEDFADGYNVEVVFDEMTSNATTGATANDKFSAFATNGYKVIDQAYNRHGSLTVYSVNGTNLSEQNVNLVDELSINNERVSISYESDEFALTNNKAYVDDNGKAGLKLKSLKSGASAEGSSIGFNNLTNGVFELDFRVESEKTYAHTATQGWSQYLQNTKQTYLLSDYYNPYADIQELSFKFTSATNPDKYFIVYIFGSASSISFATSASVFVNGDTLWEYSQTRNGKVKTQHGYGLTIAGVQNYEGGTEYGANSLAGYQNLFTPITGTSFSNFTTTSSNVGTSMPTVSNLIKFDPATMQVFVNSGKNLNNYSTTNTSADVLVRNIATNQGFSHTPTDATYTCPTLGAILPEDFANGYSVEMSLARVTDNSTVGDSQYFGGPSQYPTLSQAYDRYPTIYLYSLNGNRFVQSNLDVSVDTKKVERAHNGFVTNLNGVTVTENKLNTIDGRNGINIRSNESGLTAEGSGFTFADGMLGDFEIDFRVQSAQKYKMASTASGGWTHYVTNGSQNMMWEDTWNPYLDLKELKFTFTSLSNPNKYFDVYIRGTHGALAFSTTAYVYVPGDQMSVGLKDGSVKYGYGLSPSGIYPTNVNIDAVENYNKMPAIYGTSFSDFSTTNSTDATEARTTSNILRFDADEMKIYVNAGGAYANLSTSANYLVRSLSDNEGMSEKLVAGSLSSADFANGYNVSVTFTDVTANDVVGSTAGVGGAGNYAEIISSAYDRYADMTIYSLNGQELAYKGVPATKIKDTTLPIVSSYSNKIILNEENDVTPLFYDAASGNVIGSYGKVYYSLDNTVFTEIEKTANGYVYTPSSYGTVYVKYEDFKDNIGNVAITKTVILQVADIITPELGFVNGINQNEVYDLTSGSAGRYIASTSDIAILNRNDQVKTYTVEIIERKDPDGVLFGTAFMNFSKHGDYTVKYLVTDSFGNSSTIVRTITVGDFTAPVINVEDTQSVEVGSNIDFKNAKYSITDVSEFTLTIFIKKDGKTVGLIQETDREDKKNFTPTEVGEYTIEYVAVDNSNNETKITKTLTVTELSSSVVTDAPAVEVLDIVSYILLGVGGVSVITFAVLIIIKKRRV